MTPGRRSDCKSITEAEKKEARKGKKEAEMRSDRLTEAESEGRERERETERGSEVQSCGVRCS